MMRPATFALLAAAQLTLGTTHTTVAAPTARAQSGEIAPAELRVESQPDPLGIDVPTPRLSWIPRASRPDARGQRQTAYQVRVASSADLLRQGRADLWDSGRVPSGSGVHVSYAGRPLRSGERAYWAVRVWDRDGRASGYSAPASWEMGLLRPEDWQAAWIGLRRPVPTTDAEFYGERPAPLLRKAFVAPDRAVRRARAYVTGLGYYELHLNGAKVGDHVLDPGWTDYDERVLYATYDVTRQLRSGENVLGVALGNGWYNPLPQPMFGFLKFRETLPIGEPKALVRLHVEYADGTTQTVVSDTSWRASGGPLLKNDIYLGEVYDARREQPGWDRAGFDDRAWEVPAAMPAPRGRLRAQDVPPIKVMRKVTPVRVTEPRPGVFIVDMGENFAGWVTLRVRGEAGRRVVMRYGEALWPDGTLNVLTSTFGQVKDWGAVTRRDWAAVDSGAFWSDGAHRPKTAWQGDTYVLRGGGVESYRPRFTWHGFRYVEVRGYPGRPPLDAIEGHALYSSVAPAGEFASSSALLGKIQEITMRAQLSNMFSVQSDCPHRERFGYGGDIVAASEMAIFNLDMSRFYAKAVRDFADAQRPNGGFTEIAPDVGIAVEGLGGGAGPVGWGTAHPLLVWQLYQYYGDRGLLEEQYPNVRRWVALLRTKARDGILDNGISDHESLTPKPVALTGTAFYALNARLAAKMARVLGRPAEAAEYEALAERVTQAFDRRFRDSTSGRYDMGTQATQAIALGLDLVPRERERAALRVLEGELEKMEGHVTTGIFGTKWLLDALTRHGRADLAYAAVARRTFPGWGYMVERGATTLWESWAHPEHVASQNHPMFGSVSEWFYKGLLGINPAPDAVGFDRVIIRPNAVGDLTWARGHYDSVRGRVASAWRRDGAALTLAVEVPVSVAATVHVPAARAEDVTEGGRPASQAPGVRFLRIEDGRAVFEVGSGRYAFATPAGALAPRR
jgi:alpha-L-rhamnosidase